ncbi:MAG: flavin reductase family protein [Dehalococcoidia bacterium]|mgnify:CR=1 FL=1|nr:flavin reductase family protein [Dehalococcoidia bacterium]HRC61887.1 flavin reductase family protein [Dehalococcoidia bacterium]
MTSTAIDQRLYRDVIGRFATGVTVITFRTDHVTRGMTANAVASLSLDPTLLIACIDKRTSAHAALAQADGFAVNILAEDQLEISRLFARPGLEGMGDVEYRTAVTGAPILDGVLAWFDCAVHERFDGGDHTIFVGRVLELSLERPEADPLLFYAGGYRTLGDSL